MLSTDIDSKKAFLSNFPCPSLKGSCSVQWVAMYGGVDKPWEHTVLLIVERSWVDQESGCDLVGNW